MQDITYSYVSDYLLPDIILSDQMDAPPLGLYGMMHKTYHRDHRPILYATLLLSERIYPLCRSVDESAAHRLKIIGNHAIAHEVILSELVFV